MIIMTRMSIFPTISEQLLHDLLSLVILKGHVCLVSLASFLMIQMREAVEDLGKAFLEIRREGCIQFNDMFVELH